MARPSQEAIETFMSITGLSEVIAVQKLEEHGGDINEAVNAHFSEGDRNLAARYTPYLFAHVSSVGNRNPFSPLDPTNGRSIFDAHSDSANQAQSVTHSREVREIPVEVKDGNQYTPQADHAPTIQDAPTAPYSHQDEQTNKNLADSLLNGRPRPSVPEFESLPDHSNDIEEEMVRAAIEASKRESGLQQRQSYSEDPELAHAVSLSLKSAEQEKERRLQGDVGAPIAGPSKSPEVELGKIAASNGRLQAGSSSFQDEAEDVEEQPLIRNRSRPIYSGPSDSSNDVEVIDRSTLSSTLHQDNSNNAQHNGNPIHSDEELETQLRAKEAALPPEPSSDNENAVTLLVKMPDGSRRGRQFLRSDNLQSLFDFIDIGRVVKPGTYRLVRPYPRRAFSDGESALTLNELGLTSKQEALFLELV
ncbi:plant UBX domain-containing protein 8-like isoform X2 [Senna tora]|uniref:Plant UBX domain-containing protein 8-like isoform X2 n=1 Tax=Senna tora TaxID=362788 RepID=A0A834TTQ5_9FABA|nr:plant UBX domain-containing protein 8-like isoform X2 [Senna tora]